MCGSSSRSMTMRDNSVAEMNRDGFLPREVLGSVKVGARQH